MFNSANSGYSLSDIAAITKGNNCDGFGGGNGAWWIIILFLFVFMGGWGNDWDNGRGRHTGSGSTPIAFTASEGALTRQDLCMDMNFSDLKGSVDGIRNGMYEGFASTATQNAQGQNAIQNDISRGFADATISRMSNMNAINSSIQGLSSQLADCCCQNRYDALQNANATQRAIDTGFCKTNYNMATDTCAINNNIQSSSTALSTQIASSTRDIVDSNNEGVRAILDKMNQQELNAKDAQINALTQQVTALNLAASQQAQNNYLIEQLGQKAAIPAYVVPSPYANYGFNGCCSCGVNA